MSRVTIKQRMYLTEDKSRAVPEGDPEARHLLCAAGGEVSRADAERYGLLDEPKPEPEPEEKAAATPANKARGRAANK
ncbi:hypothetical protein [Nonomuraea sp. NPDC050202]|jgi:enoyl-CoA hydratase/carnithine racemase|uniref:hypothetical protein n=1 Tax=Nonomuraea sp. NPDC050202 TaxID=3155035 RepID=UPI0033FF08F8